MGKAKAVVVTASCGALCGALLGFSWGAAFASTAPLTLFPLFYVFRSGSRAASAGLSALYTAAMFLVGLSWIYNGAAAHQGPGAYETSLLALLFECIPYALAGAAISFAYKLSGPLWAISVASLWTLGEYWRATSPLGIPYLQMGHALIDTPLVSVARIGGTAPLTLLCVLAAAALFEVTRSRTRPGALVWTAIVAAIAARALYAPLGSIAPRGSDTVSVFQLGQVDDASIWRYISALRAQAHVGSLAIWPESSFDLSRYALLDPIEMTARMRRVALLVGGTVTDATGIHDALEFIDSSGRVKGYYAKRRLVPFGEYLPFPGLAHVIVPAAIVSSVPHLSAGRAPVTFDIGGRTIGPLICYESAFPGLARDEVRHGANMLVAATNDAWFTQGSGIWELEQTARLVAIETGTPLVLSGTVGPSGIIDARGRWSALLPVGAAASAAFTIPAAHRTPYDATGDAPWILAVLASCIACFASAAFPVKDARGGSV